MSSSCPAMPGLADQVAWFATAPVPATTADIAGAALGDLVELDGRTHTVRSLVAFPEPVGGLDGVVVLGDVAAALAFGRDPHRPVVRYDRASRVRADIGDPTGEARWEASWLASHATVHTPGRVTVAVRPVPQSLPTLRVGRSGEEVWLSPSGVVLGCRVAVRVAGEPVVVTARPLVSTVPLGAPEPSDADLERLVAQQRRSMVG